MKCETTFCMCVCVCTVCTVCVCVCVFVEMYKENEKLYPLFTLVFNYVK